jgi:hypothetical protein
MIIFVGTFTLGCIDIETLQDTNVVHQHQHRCSKKPVVTQQVTVDDENGLAFTSRSIEDSDREINRMTLQTVHRTASMTL